VLLVGLDLHAQYAVALRLLDTVHGADRPVGDWQQVFRLDTELGRRASCGLNALDSAARPGL
jgi:hypothetical protein